MKRDPELVIGGYKVPGGKGRLAVAAAVDLIKREPGVKQTEVQKHAVRFAGLNPSTAGWITSPGTGLGRPTGILWERKKVGTYRCYPNKNTEQFIWDPCDLAAEYCKQQMAGLGRLRPGDILSFDNYPGGPKTGLFLGFRCIGSYNFQQYHKGSHFLTDIFSDPNFFDDRALWGAGVPDIYCAVSTSGGIVDWNASQVRVISSAT